MALLAQLPTPSGPELLTWLGCLSLVAVLTNQLLKLKDRMFGTNKKTEIANQPLQVEGDMHVTSKGRRFNSTLCDTTHSTINQRLDSLNNEVGRIHDKIDLVERRADDNLKRSIDGLQETIRKLPAEVITLLRQTGQLTNHKHD